jgi:uncharacterized membrane protein
MSQILGLLQFSLVQFFALRTGLRMVNTASIRIGAAPVVDRFSVRNLGLLKRFT